MSFTKGKNYGPDELTEERVDGRMIYEGRILDLRVDSVRLPDGRLASREVVEHDRAVVILAENDRGEILVVRQFRYAAGEALIELPAGIVDAGEDCEAAAIRELREETGWRPGRIERIGEFFTSPGFSDELLIMYHATGLVWDELPEDEDEFVAPFFLSRDDALKMASDGRVRDAKTLFGIYWWLFRSAGRGQSS